MDKKDKDMSYKEALGKAFPDIDLSESVMDKIIAEKIVVERKRIPFFRLSTLFPSAMIIVIAIILNINNYYNSYDGNRGTENAEDIAAPEMYAKESRFEAGDAQKRVADSEFDSDIYYGEDNGSGIDTGETIRETEQPQLYAEEEYAYALGGEAETEASPVYDGGAPQIEAEAKASGGISDIESAGILDVESVLGRKVNTLAVVYGGTEDLLKDMEYEKIDKYYITDKFNFDLFINSAGNYILNSLSNNDGNYTLNSFSDDSETYAVMFE